MSDCEFAAVCGLFIFLHARYENMNYFERLFEGCGSLSNVQTDSTLTYSQRMIQQCHCPASLRTTQQSSPPEPQPTEQSRPAEQQSMRLSFAPTSKEMTSEPPSVEANATDDPDRLQFVRAGETCRRRPSLDTCMQAAQRLIGDHRDLDRNPLETPEEVSDMPGGCILRVGNRPLQRLRPNHWRRVYLEYNAAAPPGPFECGDDLGSHDVCICEPQDS